MKEKNKKNVAEFLGTFALVFAGTGAIIIDDVSGGQVTHVGVALTFGLVVTAMIYAVGDLSGAHLNPAVTIGFWAAGLLPAKQILPYVVSQCLAAISASFVLLMLFPDHGTLGATLPSGGALQAFVFEIILSFFLMFVIVNVSTGAKEKGVMAGVAVGATVGLMAMFAGPISGASMNPARSLGPALLSGNMGMLWLYIIAPVSGAVLASLVSCRWLSFEGCCENGGA